MKIESLAYKLKRAKIKLLHWEYWSFSVVYFPIYFYWVWLSIKAKSFFFFSTSNPSIENAGFIMESKKAIYDILPKTFYPATILLTKNATHKSIEDEIEKHNLQFPLVAKPDIGERGNSVKKMYDINDVMQYQQATKVNFILQEWCNYKKEIGIFYCKYPNQKKGFISGIVQKEFLTIVGDGVNTIEHFLLNSDRYFLQHQFLKQTQPQQLQKILSKGEEFILVPYGNHCRGTKFIDASNRITPQLNDAFNEICSQIPDFYFGRMDIRFESWELLEQAKSFSIIELNGAGSEPTHIYDPKHSVFFAWKEIARHLKILFDISQQNKTLENKKYLSFKEGRMLLKSKKQYDKLINLQV